MKYKIQALGIVMILFGSPIIHFFRDFAGILPKSPLIMPVFTMIFFLMILSFNHFSKIYKPNFNISVTAWSFLVYCIFLATISEYLRKPIIEIFNYTFLLVFFYLLCGVHKKVSEYIVPIVILVTLFDNFALLVAFILNPFTQLGQRAIISDVGWGEGAGNPSLYSFMAFTGILASLIYFKKSNIKWRILCLINIATSTAVIFMTLIRVTMLTLGICALLYIIYNFKSLIKKSTVKHWFEIGFSKINLILFSIGGLVIIGALFANKKLLDALFMYADSTLITLTHAIETVLQGQGDAKSSVDPSAANRIGTFNTSINLLSENPWKIIYGFGYRFLYVDIPIMQVFLEEGLIGLSIFLFFHYYNIKYINLALKKSNNDWLILLSYFYVFLLFLTSFTRGEPYDPYFWNYYITIARFLKPEDMIILKNKVKLKTVSLA